MPGSKVCDVDATTTRRLVSLLVPTAAVALLALVAGCSTTGDRIRPTEPWPGRDTAGGQIPPAVRPCAAE